MCQAQFYTPHVLYHSHAAPLGLSHLHPAVLVPFPTQLCAWEVGLYELHHQAPLLSGLQLGLSNGESQ